MNYGTKVIDKFGNIIDIPCYEIGKYFENIVNKYIDENENNKQIFKQFESNYSYFEPYLDFCLCQLGYKILNPFGIEQSILYGKGNTIYNETLEADKVISEYPKAENITFNIGRANFEDLKDGIIMPNGLKYETSDIIGHNKIFEMLLIQNMIYNKMLYEDYIKCRTNPDYSDIYYNISSYFRNRLGTIQVVIYPDKNGYILVNKMLQDDFMTNFLNSVKEFYPNIEINPSDLPPELYESSLEMKEEIGEVYENRRL